MVKKLIMAIIFAAALMATAPQALAGDISVTVDGRHVQFDEPPRIINDRVMVPMRKIFSELGADIEWDRETNTATAVKDAQYAQFTADSGYMLYGVCRNGLNNDEFEYAGCNELDSAPVIEDDTMFIPVRAVSEAFYYTVEWHPDWNVVEIMTPPLGDGWIYYSSWTDGGHMYRIDTNGRNRQLLSYNDCYLSWGFQYLNGYIYYSIRGNDEGCLYRIRTDGMKEERLTDEPVRVPTAYNANQSDNMLYFVEGVSSADNINATGILKAVDGKTDEIVTISDKSVSMADYTDLLPGYEVSDSDNVVDIHEYVKYGVVVYNDGRVKRYKHASAKKYN